MNKELFLILQIVLGVALTSLILIQTKGTGLGGTFGGELGFYRTKRGFEKLLFYATLILAAAFLISAFIGLLW